MKMMKWRMNLLEMFESISRFHWWIQASARTTIKIQFLYALKFWNRKFSIKHCVLVNFPFGHWTQLSSAWLCLVYVESWKAFGRKKIPSSIRYAMHCEWHYSYSEFQLIRWYILLSAFSGTRAYSIYFLA